MKGMKYLLLGVAAATLASCGSMKLATVTTEIAPESVMPFAGSSLAIVAPEIDLEPSTSKVDLREAELTVNGQKIQLMGRYLDEVDDMFLGRVGILDTNIFKKAKVDVASLGGTFASLLLKGLEGKEDFRFPINPEQLGAGDYSSRPLVYDFTAYPYAADYAPDGKSLESVFSAVTLGGGGDLSLDIVVTIRSDVVEILTDDVYIQNKYLGADHQPHAGDYYLITYAYVSYELKDAKTGKVVLNQKTNKASIATYVVDRVEYLPVKNKDAEAFATYFRTYDFNRNAEALVTELAHGMIPAFRPVYRNLNQYVKVEEGQ